MPSHGDTGGLNLTLESSGQVQAVGDLGDFRTAFEQIALQALLAHLRVSEVTEFQVSVDFDRSIAVEKCRAWVLLELVFTMRYLSLVRLDMLQRCSILRLTCKP